MTIKELLIEEIEGKKPFIAKWATECDVCGGAIEEEDEFFFFGDKKKVDSKCIGDMSDLIERTI